MCMIDWRVARLVRPNVIFAGATSGIIPQNQQRIGLVLASGIPATAFGVDVMRLSIAGGSSFFYSRDYASPSEVLSVQEYGSLLTGSIELSTAADENQLSVIELTLPEDYLSAGLGEFMSQYKIGSPYGEVGPPKP